MSQYSVHDAAQKASAWCAAHPAWLRICDLPDGYHDACYVQWRELSPRQQATWNSEAYYNEFARKRCKVKTGYITGAGAFVESITEVPMGHNLMMVFCIGRAEVKRIQAIQADHQKR